MTETSKYPNLEALIHTIDILRSPNGCAWDREQTHATLKRNILEESYETVDAINSGDMENLKEELGDVLLQVVLHSQIAKENGDFTIEDVAKRINDKLILRHPHVFGDIKEDDPEKIIQNWEEIKKKEKPERTSQMDGISKAQSALMTAQKISKRAVAVGFEWPNYQMLEDTFLSEYKEFKQALENNDKVNMEEELGDILFSAVNLARFNGIDAEQALIKSNQKFIVRFKKMESLSNKNLKNLSFEEYNELWEKAKLNTKKS